MHSLASIRSKLGTVRTAVRALYVADGLLRLTAVILGLLLLSFVLDFGLHFPLPLRMIALAGIALAIAIAAVRYVAFPCRVPITIEDVAAQVELRNPFLKDRLISALQLDRHLEDPEYADSVPLTQALIREAEELAGGIRFFSILHPKPVVIAGALVLASLIGAGVVAGQFPTQAKVWALRNLALTEIDWPRKTEVHLIRRSLTAASDKPVLFRFELERGAAAPDLEALSLLVLERVEGGGSDNGRLLTLRREGELAELRQLAAAGGQLVYRQRRLAVAYKTVDGVQVLEASLPPSRQTRYCFLANKRRYRMPLISLEREQAASPIYEVQAATVVNAEATVLQVPMDDGDIYVPRGHTLKLEALVFGPIEPGAGAMLHHREEGSSEIVDDMMARVGAGNRFEYDEFDGIRQPVTFELSCGDSVRGPAYRILVRVPPKLTEHRLDVAMPAFLGRRPKPELATSRDLLNMPLGTSLGVRIVGDFAKAPEDTKAMSRGAAYSASLRFDNELLAPIELTAGAPQAVAGTDRVRVAFSGSFRATMDSSFFFVLRGPNRLINENPRYFNLTVANDAAPTVALRRPVSNYRASKDGNIRLRIDARDDYGLGKIVLRYRVDDAKDYRELVLKKAGYAYADRYQPGTEPTGEGREPTKLTLSYKLALDQIVGLAEQSTLRYHIMAQDYAAFSRDEKGALVTRDEGQRTYAYASGYLEREANAERPEFEIRIVSKLDIEKEINDRLQRLRDVVLDLRKRQGEITKGARTFKTNTTYSTEDLDQIFRLQLRQNDVIRGVREDVRRQLLEVQEVYEENHLTPAANLGELIRLASLIVRDEEADPGLGLRSAQLLKDVQNQGEVAVQRATLGDAIEVQGKIDATFAEMLEHLSKWKDMSEVLQAAQELLDWQRDINERTKSLRDKR